ncbi:low affinity iron permease family protein [Pseudomonas protegens]|uniref:low affinity iron permease family protein n=1 Tax=Pseudomonas protegens TaxID=380021 RepID=UPI00215E2525|nr:low affinity iron permease family protein [Pseudomonas protegens]MDK1394226.1 low affinity iron permease family protein [Pseudomonas protegens]UVL74087.1 low affinity iron permease family protein [Pseudomonas protegens]
MKFSKISQTLSMWAGSPKTFLGALLLILIWGLSGPVFHFNDTWQLIINTSTTIITFLMVFLIQNTQNRDNDILHLKIDELLRATKAAHNAMLSLDGLDLKQLEQMRREYREIGQGGDSELSVSTSSQQDKTDLNQC